jgi:hypothetical protein
MGTAFYPGTPQGPPAGGHLYPACRPADPPLEDPWPSGGNRFCQGFPNSSWPVGMRACGQSRPKFRERLEPDPRGHSAATQGDTPKVSPAGGGQRFGCREEICLSHVWGKF